MTRIGAVVDISTSLDNLHQPSAVLAEVRKKVFFFQWSLGLIYSCKYKMPQK
jgi:hypothetical protein